MPTPPPTTALTDREEIDEIPVGGSVDGRLDEPGETDRFLFQADEGTAYQIKAVWDTLPSIRVDIYDAYIRDGFPTFGKVKEASREPFRLVWTAPESGKYNLDVSSGDDLGSGTGTYTVFVSIDTGPLAGPTNVRYAPEGTAVRVSRIPVEGADYYNIYHDELSCLRVSAGRGWHSEPLRGTGHECG